MADSELNDADAKQPAAQSNVVAVSERTFLRLTFWQTILSLAGVFTGVVALYAALSESQAVREQTAASVWPYVQVMIADNDDGSSARFAMSFDNVGVGPARMRGVQLRINGEIHRNWEEVARQLVDREMRLGVDFGRNSVASRVIAPGERITAFQTENRELALAIQQAVYGGAVDLRYCFCSIFEQCWLGTLTPESEFEGPSEVEACPAFKDGAFRN